MKKSFKKDWERLKKDFLFVFGEEKTRETHPLTFPLKALMSHYERILNFTVTRYIPRVCVCILYAQINRNVNGKAQSPSPCQLLFRQFMLNFNALVK